MIRCVAADCVSYSLEYALIFARNFVLYAVLLVVFTIVGLIMCYYLLKQKSYVGDSVWFIFPVSTVWGVCAVYMTVTYLFACNMMLLHSVNEALYMYCI